LPSPKAAVVILVAVALALAIGNSYETFRRSTIPLGIEGSVESLEVRREKHPGVDDVHLLVVQGKTIHVDAEVASVLNRGAELQKDAWSPSLRIDQVSHQLSPSRDSRGMLVVMPVVLLVLAGLLYTGVSRPQSP
jgi:hypothetical protein